MKTPVAIVSLVTHSYGDRSRLRLLPPEGEEQICIPDQNSMIPYNIQVGDFVVITGLANEIHKAGSNHSLRFFHCRPLTDHDFTDEIERACFVRLLPQYNTLTSVEVGGLRVSIGSRFFAWHKVAKGGPLTLSYSRELALFSELIPFDRFDSWNIAFFEGHNAYIAQMTFAESYRGACTCSADRLFKLEVPDALRHPFQSAFETSGIIRRDPTPVRMNPKRTVSNIPRGSKFWERGRLKRSFAPGKP